MAFIQKIRKDKQGFKYIFMDLKLNELEVIFSERHKALLVVDKDSKDYNRQYYEHPNLIEIKEKDEDIQFGIVQNIPVEDLEELLKAYVVLKEQNMIPKERNLEGLELLKNKNKPEKTEKAKKTIKKIEKKENSDPQMCLLGFEETEVGEEYEVENDNDCNSDFLGEGDED